jgi:hypothetical protein
MTSMTHSTLCGHQLNRQPNFSDVCGALLVALHASPGAELHGCSGLTCVPTDPAPSMRIDVNCAAQTAAPSSFSHWVASHSMPSWWHCRASPTEVPSSGALWNRLHAHAALQLAAALLLASPAPSSLLCMSLDGCHTVDGERTTEPRGPPALSWVEEEGCDSVP